MDQVEVEITGMAITARYGTLKSGTKLRTDAAYAKHLVEDCGAAKYTTPGTTKQAAAPATKPTKQGSSKADKATKADKSTAPQTPPAPDAAADPAAGSDQAQDPAAAEPQSSAPPTGDESAPA
jgi:hypothetical protein